MSLPTSLGLASGRLRRRVESENRTVCTRSPATHALQNRSGLRLGPLEPVPEAHAEGVIQQKDQGSTCPSRKDRRRRGR